MGFGLGMGYAMGQKGKKKFKMRKPPVKPVRGFITFRHSYYENGQSFVQLIEGLAKAVIGYNLPGYEFITKDWLLQNLDRVKLGQESGYYPDDNWETSIYIIMPESDKEWDEALLDYKEKLEQYNSWCKNHAVEIRRHEEALAKKAEEDRLKAIEESAARQEQERVRLTKQLNQIQTKLKKFSPKDKDAASM